MVLQSRQASSFVIAFRSGLGKKLTQGYVIFVSPEHRSSNSNALQITHLGFHQWGWRTLGWRLLSLFDDSMLIMRTLQISSNLTFGIVCTSVLERSSLQTRSWSGCHTFLAPFLTEHLGFHLFGYLYVWGLGVYSLGSSI